MTGSHWNSWKMVAFQGFGVGLHHWPARHEAGGSGLPGREHQAPRSWEDSPLLALPLGEHFAGMKISSPSTALVLSPVTYVV